MLLDDALVPFQNPDGPAEARQRCAKLPEASRAAAELLLDEVPQDEDRLAEVLGPLGAKARKALIAALCPAFAAQVEDAWYFVALLPYQHGYLRKAFRAPAQPELCLPAQAAWLRTIVRALVPFQHDRDFLFTHAARVSWGSEEAVAILLASMMQAHRKEDSGVRETLVEIVNARRPTVSPSRYAISALLSTTHGDWETVMRLLIAAQRQEGLRQAILESADIAHPRAFTLLLEKIDEHDLTRFAAVARAVGVWFGIAAESADGKNLTPILREVAAYLAEPEELESKIGDASGQALYLALWCVAFRDATRAAELAAEAFGRPAPDDRIAAVTLLLHLRTPDADRLLVKATADAELRVAIPAATRFAVSSANDIKIDHGEVFDALERLLERTPDERDLGPILWEWNRITARRADIAGVLTAYRQDRPIEDLARHLYEMDTGGRIRFLYSLRPDSDETRALTPGERDAVLSLMHDASSHVRQHAFVLLEKEKVSPAQARQLEPLLKRKSADLRRAVLRLLLNQSPGDVRASADRLSASKDAFMRKAAPELLAALDESPLADTVAGGLGLFNPADRTPPAALRAGLEPDLGGQSTAAALAALDALVDQHRETEIPGDAGSRLLGGVIYLSKPADGEFPLARVWAEWLASLGSAVFDRVRIAFALTPRTWRDEADERAAAALWSQPKLQYPGVVDCVLRYLEDKTDWGDAELPLDALEAFLEAWASAPPAEQPSRPWMTVPLGRHSSVAGDLFALLKPGASWSAAEWKRYWQLARWMEEGIDGGSGWKPPLDTALEARRAGAATDADLCAILGDHRYLTRATSRKPDKLCAAYPELAEFGARVRDRVIEIELERGDLPTDVSFAAFGIRCAWGSGLVLRLLARIGNDGFARGYNYGNQSRPVVLSHLMRVCLPAEGDTPEQFARLARERKMERQRLIELAAYAPQWAEFVEEATGVAGLREAVLWLHAHTKDRQWVVDDQIRELWFAAVSERTPLAKEDLLDGAVDVDWFHRVHAAMKPADWDAVFEAAKYASNGAGHKRAQSFAEALAGAAKPDTLIAAIRGKRTQDGVRALGLVPLPEREPARRDEVLRRYEAIQEFLRGAKKFGAQRQESERLAASIGLANLARTAGYADPQRFSWAMEAAVIADLREGPAEVTGSGVRAALSINALGEPELAYDRGGKPLKNLPPALKKSEPMATLRARKTELGRQVSRMRQSLEEAMVRGDRFSAADLDEMASHPMLAPMLEALTLVDGNGAVGWFSEMRAGANLRIAHATALLASNQWPRLQRECIDRSIRQPFKQLFRELYVLTKAERATRTYSARYEGQQVNPAQALAVIGKRGWVNVPEEGLRRTFHHHRISAWVWFLDGWLTPVEVDGLTVQHVSFTDRDGELALERVPPALFSEAMRDVDLMVSVAHRGGVDPEASASTVEMRAALVRETARLMKLANVRVKNNHVLIDGKLGNYGVHLGSAVVHRLPGGSICIVPVHSQHRGRLFLPFADDDPKTAEVVSKVVLLAGDDRIQDPSIVEQLRG
ncbi:MAG: DUF5724 domain-containing protein [Bryobacteraceae bacterium]